MPYTRLPVPYPEDEACNGGTSPSRLPEGGALRLGHHSGEEGGARMAPPSPSRTGDPPVLLD